MCLVEISSNTKIVIRGITLICSQWGSLSGDGVLKNIKTSAKPIGIDVETSTSKSAEEDIGVTATLEAGFLDESLTADATELLDLELSNKLHSSISSDTSSTI
ncbi:hypothetical protein AVEN_60603-1 [Araneus ventricosus]|uniref:Uncharacterized protein n=1 Tax=Araneus ventricosus TaxID=182803 RepID=A0A4Y2MSQ3_ARAVE|nr:hypothetical protein AVEN_60603-1 [Araneus ventricosus]